MGLLDAHDVTNLMHQITFEVCTLIRVQNHRRAETREYSSYYEVCKGSGFLVFGGRSLAPFSEVVHHDQDVTTLGGGLSWRTGSTSTMLMS